MALGGLLALLGAYLVFVLVIAVVMLISMWKIYSKAGQPGWAVFRCPVAAKAAVA